ncbi:MAG: SPOR domain-containing protein [Pseudomonadales bacterium]
MDVKLKQRVIGAIVFTTLAIIVLPMILDGSSEDREKVVATVPEPPSIELEKLRVEEVRRQMEVMEAESAARLPQPAADDEQESVRASDMTQATEADKVRENGDTGAGYELDEDKLPVGWALQVASFRDQEKAVDLRASLRESDYRTYIIQAETPEGPTYRVLIGPVNQKQKLRAIRDEIQSSLNLKGFIVRYRVEDDQRQLGG